MKTIGAAPTPSEVDIAGGEAQARGRTASPTAGGVLEVAASPDVDHADRDAFSLRLQQHYHQHAVNDTPFLLIALRSDGEAARQLDFPFLCDCVRHLLGENDAWFLDPEKKRLILLLAPGRDEDAHRFFARLKQRLLQTTPQQAGAYLHAVTAIVVPDGGAFQNAEEFLAAALEE